MKKTVVCTALALIAFALNSILCRLALRGGEADPVAFTVLRLASGAGTLLIVNWIVKGRPRLALGKNLDSGLYLSVYAFFFSLAYVGLTAGVGALILFGSVQISMMAVAAWRGERPQMLESVGIVIAFGGLIYLVLPGLGSAPELAGSLSMIAAGIAWGLYSLRAKVRKRKKQEPDDPLIDTTSSFIVALFPTALASLQLQDEMYVSAYGVVIAILSGSLTSGVGYVIWYWVVKRHPPTRAAVLQLTVPVITAVLSVLFLGEILSLRLVVAGLIVVGGIGLTILGKKVKSSPKIV